MKDTLNRIGKHHRPAIIEGKVAKIPLGVRAKHGYAIVDVEFAWLDKFRWTISGSTGYAKKNPKKSMAYMHHWVAGKPDKGQYTDHINRNKLDNRRENLRYVTPTVNAINRGLMGNNTSGITGVSWDNYYQKWRVKIKRGDKVVSVYRVDKDEAIKLRKELEEIHHAEA